MHHVLRPAGVVAGLVLVALLCLPAPAIAVDVSSPRCAEAESLTTAGEPRDAAKLIDDIRAQYKDPTLCADEAADADEAIRTPAAPTPLTPASWLDATAERWTGFADGAGKDLATLGGVAAAAIALAVLLGRLLLLVPFSSSRVARSLAEPGARARTGVDLVTAYVVLALLAAVSVPETLTAPTTSTSVTLLVATALALAAAALLTWALLLTRRRVRIEITDKGAEAEAGAAAIVAHVRAMGSGPPRGLEVPIGSDVQTLSGANITAGVKGPFGTLVSVLQSFLAVTPWRVLVDRESDDQAVVVISRHGRVVDTAVVRHRPWAVPGQDGSPAVDINVMVAARVLMTLLDAEESHAGLSGARDWRSVGWQYDGATMPHSPEERLVIYAKAGAADPANVAALLSYRLERYRDSDDPRDLRHLICWLTLQADRMSHSNDETALVARMRFAAYVTMLNRNTLPHETEDPVDRRSGLTTLADLHSLLTSSVEALEDPVFKNRLQSSVDLLQPAARHHPKPGEPLDLQPVTAYSLACFAAEEGGVEGWRRAVGYLEFAGPYALEHAPRDPSLKALRGSQEYRKAFGPAPRELLEVEPFASVADRLRFSALTTAPRIAACGAQQLSLSLAVSGSQARELVGAAELALDVPEALGAHRAELVTALVAHGVKDVNDLRSRTRRGRDHTTRRAVEAAYADRGAALPPRADLRRWLYAYPASSRGGSSAG
ncbi:hypothetical protein [Nocardioides aurantiacus]|uniref:hypothetical protein n=1 Tax=Nocardioides aurantiacus TaxID=86796 RepID=UPI000F486C70|nr:hypothetical protein [Nocardioides aurantiacus]